MAKSGKTSKPVTPVEVVSENQLRMASDTELFSVLTNQKEYSDHTAVAMKVANNLVSRGAQRLRKRAFGFRVVSQMSKVLDDPETMTSYIHASEPEISKLLPASRNE